MVNKSMNSESCKIVAENIVRVNPHLNVTKLMNKAKFSKNQLVTWKLSDLRLISLPESFGNIRVGGNLDLAGNELRSLPSSFGDIKVGRDLGLENNELTSLPDKFGKITVGGKLNLHDNALTSLPGEFGNITVGGELNLSENALTSLPVEFGNITVGALNLSKNALTSLPDGFGSNLKIGGELKLSKNNLTSLPVGFGNNLKIGGDLILCHNKLESLPHTCRFMQVDGNLDLRYTLLRKFLDSAEDWKLKVKELMLPLPYMPRENYEKNVRDPIVNMNNLTIAALKNRATFTKLSPECFVLKKLNLSDLQIQQLPKSFCSMSVVYKLDLSNNKLKSLPVEFGNIKVGGDLNLSDNQLESLPPNFGNLNIGNGELDLSNNKLKSLPVEFGNIKVGGDLNLSDNQLESLPPNFGNLNIGNGELDLSNNRLTTLPDGIKKIVCGTIDFRYNLLKSFFSQDDYDYDPTLHHDDPAYVTMVETLGGSEDTEDQRHKVVKAILKDSRFSKYIFARLLMAKRDPSDTTDARLVEFVNKAPGKDSKYAVLHVIMQLFAFLNAYEEFEHSVEYGGTHLPPYAEYIKGETVETMAKLLEENKVEYDLEGALMKAVSFWSDYYYDISTIVNVAKVLSKYVDQEDRNAALHSAVDRNQIELVEVLLDCGAEAGHIIVHHELYGKVTTTLLVTALLTCDWLLSANDWVGEPDFAIVNLLLQKGVDPNMPETHSFEDGRAALKFTPLWIAATCVIQTVPLEISGKNSRPQQAVQLLLDAKADPSTTTNEVGDGKLVLWTSDELQRTRKVDMGNVAKSFKIFDLRVFQEHTPEPLQTKDIDINERTFARIDIDESKFQNEACIDDLFDINARQTPEREVGRKLLEHIEGFLKKPLSEEELQHLNAQLSRLTDQEFKNLENLADKSILQCQEEIPKIEGEIQKIEGEIQKIEGEIQKIEGEIQNIEGEIRGETSDKIEQEERNKRQKLTRSKKRTHQLQEHMDAVAKLQTDVAKLQTDVAELQTDVAELQTDVEMLTIKVAIAIEIKINRLSAQKQKKDNKCGSLQQERKKLLDYYYDDDERDLVDKGVDVSLEEILKRLGPEDTKKYEIMKTQLISVASETKKITQEIAELQASNRAILDCNKTFWANKEGGHTVDFIKGSDNFVFVVPDPYGAEMHDVICYDRWSLLELLSQSDDGFLVECIGREIPIDGGKKIDRAMEFAEKTNAILYMGLPITADDPLVYVDIRKLKTLLLLLDRGVKVFYLEPQMGSDGQAMISHTASYKNAYNTENADLVSANHCQHGSKILLHDIKLCGGNKCKLSDV